MLLKILISQLGIDPRRVRLEWISTAEGRKFAQVITDFTNEIKELGPYLKYLKRDGSSMKG